MTAISRFFRNLWSRLFAGGGHRLPLPLPFDPVSDKFLPINTEMLAVRIDVDSKARQRGIKNLPPSDQETPDDVERAIALELANLGDLAYNAIDDRFKTIKSLNSALVEPDAVNRISAIAVPALTKMCAEVSTGVGILHNLGLRFHMAQADFNKFLADNGITRPADYPKNRFLLISILALLLVVETGANASLFAKANEFGLFGAFAEMIGISFINLTCGFATGCIVLPQLARKIRSVWHAILRIAAAAIVFSAIFGILIFNVFVGHYRDVLAISTVEYDIADSGAEAVRQLIADPFGLREFDSWVFVFLGIIFAGIALIDGLKWDDIIPGFGKKTRVLEDATQDYNRRFEFLQGSLAKSEKAIEDKVADISEKATHHKKSLEGDKERIIGLQDKLRAYYTQLETVGQILTERYRTANRAARTTAAPRYFSAEVVFDNRPIPDIDLGLAADVEMVQKERARTTKVVQEVHLVLFQIYQTIKELSQKELEERTTVEGLMKRIAEAETLAVSIRRGLPGAEAGP